jgi:L-aminopeptidase/D-esterase-like protein
MQEKLFPMGPDLPKIQAGRRNLISDIDGLCVGHAHDAKARSGVSVILPENPAIAAVSVPGGGPGTRETDALQPANLVERADAVVLSGGSVHGLDAASGVTAALAQDGRGYPTGAPIPSPIVPAAILFDLANGGDKKWGLDPPYRQLGLTAYGAATPDFDLGNIGAGYGAQAGTLKGGLGSASAVLPGSFSVGALIAANPVGNPGGAGIWSASSGRAAGPSQRSTSAPWHQIGGFGGRCQYQHWRGRHRCRPDQSRSATRGDYGAGRFGPGASPHSYTL